MPSAFTHAAAALSIGTWFRHLKFPKEVFLAAAICSAIPDLDVIGFAFGVNYSDFLGHRGFTHSLVFALLLAVVVVLVIFRRKTSGIGKIMLVTYIFLAAASHGLLDALTDGGLGVAFFSPFDLHRYFFPWTPIRVAPVSPARFFTARGFAVFLSELVWVWVPSIALGGLALLSNRKDEQQDQVVD